MDINALKEQIRIAIAVSPEPMEPEVMARMIVDAYLDDLFKQIAEVQPVNLPPEVLKALLPCSHEDRANN